LFFLIPCKKIFKSSFETDQKGPPLPGQWGQELSTIKYYQVQKVEKIKSNTHCGDRIICTSTMVMNKSRDKTTQN
jgi:hypothetical protein